MTPKDKAKELVNKFIAHSYHNDNELQCKDHAKQSALIAVDEILAEFHMHDYSDYMEHRFQYFRQVKKEIENL